MIDSKTEALERMDSIAQELHKLDEQRNNLRIEYWGLQAVAYPMGECQHGSTHFCSHCCGGNNS
jgi:hypothetical protein